MRARRGPSRDLDVERRLTIEQIVLAKESLGDSEDPLDGRLRRRRNAKLTEPALETGLMPAGLEELAANDAPHLVDAIAKDEPAVERRNAGVGRGDKLSIEIDEHATSVQPRARGVQGLVTTD